MTLLTRKETFNFLTAIRKFIRFVEEEKPFEYSNLFETDVFKVRGQNIEYNNTVSILGKTSIRGSRGSMEPTIRIWIQTEKQNIGKYDYINLNELKTLVDESEKDEVMFSLSNTFKSFHNEVPVFGEPDQYKLTELTDYINRITRL